MWCLDQEAAVRGRRRAEEVRRGWENRGGKGGWLREGPK